MLQIDSFTAWIVVEGVELKEYSVEVSDDGKCATCWIPSELGKNFSVHRRDSRKSCMTSGRVRVDGIYCDSNIIFPESKTDTRISNGIQVSEQTYRPYMFSKIHLTDDDTYLNSSSSQHIGEIKLSIWRIRVVGPGHYKSNKEGIATSRTVHERAKKGTSHCVGFGEERVNQPVYRKTKYLDKAPIASFLFKYRPLEILRANGIAPALPVSTQDGKRKASASPERDLKPDITASDDDDDSDVEEMAILKDIQEKLDALQAKRAKKGKKPAVLKKIKTEAAQIGSKFVPGEIIDLT